MGTKSENCSKDCPIFRLKVNAINYYGEAVYKIMPNKGQMIVNFKMHSIKDFKGIMYYGLYNIGEIEFANEEIHDITTGI